jgi:hypothetical protein
MLGIRGGAAVSKQQYFVSCFQCRRNYLNDTDNTVKIFSNENIRQITAFLKYLYDMIFHVNYPVLRLKPPIFCNNIFIGLSHVKGRALMIFQKKVLNRIDEQTAAQKAQTLRRANHMV